MVTWLPELHKWRKTGRALALDVFLNEKENKRYTCMGYENGKISLAVVSLTNEGAIVLKEFNSQYSATVSAILFLKSGQLLVAATWEGAVFYYNVENGFEESSYVEKSSEFDVVTSLCTARRLDGNGFCLGTFGKQLMVYKVQEENCILQWKREFRSPILQLRSFDITGDGLQDIAVISGDGLHLLQLNYRLVEQKLVEKILQLENLGKSESD